MRHFYYASLKHFFKTSRVVGSITSALLLFLLGLPHEAKAQISNIPPTVVQSGAVPQLIKVRIPSLDEEGIVAEVHLPPAQAKDLVDNSPAALRKKTEALQKHIAKMCAGRPGIVGQVIQEFPSEVAAFYTGLAVAASHEIEKDPGAVKHFYEQNLADPLAHVSFAFFMIGNRSTAALLSFMGLNFDPCRHIRMKNARFTTKIDPLTGKFDYDVEVHPTRLQRSLSFLVGPVGMAGGFMLSTVAHELMADPNIRMCAAGLVRKMSTDELKARDAACDEAYKHWVTTRKIMGYVPDILSMSAASLVQAYVVNYGGSKALAAGRHALKGPIAGMTAHVALSNSRVLSLTLRSVLVMTGAVPGGAVVRFGLAAAHAAIFITLNEIILPYIKFPWERRTQGKDITASINEVYSELDRLEKNKWQWKSRPKSPYCDYQPSAEDYAFGAPVLVGPSDCVDSTRPGVLIKDLGEKYRKWREFVLSDAYMAHSNWTDYLVRFQNTYTNARAFYKDLLYAISWKRTPGLPKSDIVEKLFTDSPFRGLKLNVPERICSLMPGEKDTFRQAAELAQKALDEKTSNNKKRKWVSVELHNLRKIRDGFSAATCSYTLARAEETDNFIRRKMLQEALNTLNEELYLLEGPIRNDPMALANLQEWYGDRNVYLRMRKLIGQAEPLTEGVAYLIEANENPALIEQSLKHEHPTQVGYGAQTPSMVDYLLAQMVCGPEADPTQELKLQNYEAKKKSSWEKVAGYFGMDFSTAARIRSPESMLYVEYAYEDAVAPAPRVLNSGYHPNSLQQISRTYGIRAEFRPPKIIENIGDICGQHPENIKMDEHFWDIHTAKFKVNGKPHIGFLELVKNYVRPNVIGSNVDDFKFNSWWESQVDPHVIRVVELMRDDFVHILEKQFLPAFTRTDEVTYNGRKFETGVARSILAESRFNLLLVGKSLQLSKSARSRNNKLADIHDKYASLFNEFMMRMKLQTELFSDATSAHKAVLEVEKITLEEKDRPRNLPRQKLVRPSDSRFRVAYEVNKIVLNQVLQELSALSEASAAAGAPPTEILNEVREAAVANLSTLVTETDSYFNLIDTVRVPGAQ